MKKPFYHVFKDGVEREAYRWTNADLTVGGIVTHPKVIDKSVTIKKGAEVVGKTPIGEDSQIGENAFLRFAKCVGKTTAIEEDVKIGECVDIGNYVNIGAGTTIDNWASIECWVDIGKAVTINYGAAINQYSNIGDVSEIRNKACIGRNAKIGKDVEIGWGAVVGHMVTIGDDCSVHGDIADYCKIEAGDLYTTFTPLGSYNTYGVVFSKDRGLLWYPRHSSMTPDKFRKFIKENSSQNYAEENFSLIDAIEKALSSAATKTAQIHEPRAEDHLAQDPLNEPVELQGATP